MAAVIRLKRRLDEEPVDSLLLNCKRRKTSNDEAIGDISTVVTRAGTSEDPEEDVLKHVKIQTKEELEEQFKKHSVDVREKLRVQHQLAMKDGRYKVVNLRRFEASDKVTVVDVESEEKESEESQKDGSKYVYDLYYMPKEKVSELNIEDVDVFPWENPVELVFDNEKEEEVGSDSEDSNAENNWRNDYPDEEDDDITEQDMLDAMGRLDVNESRDLSSDDGEEGFVYSIDSEAIGFEEDIDPTDVSRYGEMYARFKARMKHSDDLGGCGSYDSSSD